MALTKSLKEIIEEDKTGLLSKHESWGRICLGDVASVLNGYPFESRLFHPSVGKPLIRIRDVITGMSETFYTGEFDKQFVVNLGDLLIGMDGDFNTARWKSQPALLNQRVCKITPDERVYSAKLLEYALPGFLAAIHAATSSVTVKHLSSRSIGEIELPLPPAAEQTRIVEKLEELLSDLDAGVAELKAAQKKLGQYRQSLLKAAVEGALTADWRKSQKTKPAESGAQLLKRILHERRTRWEAKQLAKFKEQGKTPAKGWQSKYVEPVAPETAGLPELPEEWVWASLDSLIDEGPQNGLYLPATLYGRGCPMLRIDDFQIGWARSREKLNLVDADADTVATYALRAGDLVINRVNSMTHLGKSLVVSESLSGVLFESNMMRSRLLQLINSDYVGLYLGSELGRKRLTSTAKWAVNQASINQQDVKKTPVPISSFAEQCEIAVVVGHLLMAAEVQAKAITHSLKQASAQRKNILKAAFSGQLVPQDPQDEPASALLARIRAQRVKQGALPKVRKSKIRKDVHA